MRPTQIGSTMQTSVSETSGQQCLLVFDEETQMVEVTVKSSGKVQFIPFGNIASMVLKPAPAAKK